MRCNILLLSILMTSLRATSDPRTIRAHSRRFFFVREEPPTQLSALGGPTFSPEVGGGHRWTGRFGLIGGQISAGLLWLLPPPPPL